VIKARWKRAKEGNANWRTEAASCYKFVAGDQWESDDKSVLENEDRPAITFNRVDVFIDAICGMEVNNRQAIHYFPREINDTGLNQAFTAAAKYVRDQTDAESEESESFRDATICGLGVTRTRMDYCENPEGDILQERVDPLQVWPDPGSRKRCLKDRRYTFHGEYMDREEASKKWPDAVLSATAPELETVIDTDRNWLYKDEENNIYESKDKVFILYYEEVRKEPYYKAKNPLTGQIEEITPEVYEKLKKIPDLKAVKMERNVYYRTFCNAEGEELEPLKKSPVQDFDYKFITYKRDRSKGCWYGIVRHMMDPQRWANKWLSQILHIINTNAKGGAFAEAGAFLDPKKAEEDWSKSSPLILMREGAVSQGKIKERTPSAYPNGLDRLMMLAFEALPMVSGVNLEILGLANREQAGVLEDQRRQSAFAILAPLFDSLRQYRKEQGRLLLKYISEFFEEGRLVRIIGQNGTVQYIPLMKDENAQNMDVIVDQSPDSPDFKKHLWEMLQVMLPAMMKAGYPIPPSVIQYIPNLPLDLAQEWIQYVQQSMQQASPEQMQQLQEELNKLGEENQGLKEQIMSMKLDNTVDQMKLQQKASEAMMKGDLKLKEIASESESRYMEIMVEAQIEKMSMALDAKIKMAQAMMDAQIKAWSEQMKAESADKKIESEAQKAPPMTINVDTKTDVQELLDQQAKSIESMVSGLTTKVEGAVSKVEGAANKKRRVKAKRGSDGSWDIQDV
jgi:DNA-directed RNA polymerase subunit L